MMKTLIEIAEEQGAEIGGYYESLTDSSIYTLTLTEAHLKSTIDAVNAQESEPVDKGSYVKIVPDHCDRIVWRNRYYHLDNLAHQPIPPAVAEYIERLEEALTMYANADFYFGCAFLFDRPTGGFDDDFTDNYWSETGHDYGRPMPGKLALESLSSRPKG